MMDVVASGERHRRQANRFDALDDRIGRAARTDASPGAWLLDGERFVSRFRAIDARVEARAALLRRQQEHPASR
jgi:hypothetical protein